MALIAKSASITAMDSTPLVEVTSGEGISGWLKNVNDFATILFTGSGIGDLYRFVRFPTTAKVKKVFLVITSVSTAGAMDIGVGFSDSTVDGTPQSLATLANPMVQLTGPADNKLFGSAQALTAAIITPPKEITFSGTAFPFLPVHQNLPLWQALVNLGATQFTADPGGYFDIVGKATTAPTVTNTVASIEVDYVQGP
jgi:hypothetical protein